MQQRLHRQVVEHKQPPRLVEACGQQVLVGSNNMETKETLNHESILKVYDLAFTASGLAIHAAGKPYNSNENKLHETTNGDMNKLIN